MKGSKATRLRSTPGRSTWLSSDDGINGVSSTGGGGAMQGRTGPRRFESGDSHLAINGGYLAVDALGDGIDINGAIDMTGGTVLVNGPTANNNGALDHSRVQDHWRLPGGGRQRRHGTGARYDVHAVLTDAYLCSSSQAAGTLVSIETKDGKTLLTFAPTKTYQSIVVSSPEIKNGSTCVVYSGGRSTGTVADSLYSGVTYTAGTQVASYTISSIVTGAGAGMGGMPGGRGGMRPPKP